MKNLSLANIAAAAGGQYVGPAEMQSFEECLPYVVNHIYST